MRTDYDFSKGRPNPYVKKMKQQITIRLDTDLLIYFKKLASKVGISYQNLINNYLRECADYKKAPSIKWA